MSASRMERSIFGWLGTAGAHRAKVTFSSGEMEDFAAKARGMNLAGMRLLFFDSPQQVAWILVEGRFPDDVAARDAEMERVTAALTRVAKLATALGSKIHFIAPRK